MNNTIIEGDDASDALYGVSAVYLVIVAISGGAFNIMAFVKAIKVSLNDTRMKWEIRIHEILNYIFYKSSNTTFFYVRQEKPKCTSS